MHPHINFVQYHSDPALTTHQRGGGGRKKKAERSEGVNREGRHEELKKNIRRSKLKVNKKSYQQLLVMEIVTRIFNFTVINWIDTLTSDGRLSLEKPDMSVDQICLHIGICAKLTIIPF